MERKIIQQSPTSKGISLPSKWVKRWNLEKGAVVSVIDNEGILEIRPREFAPPKKVATIDANFYGKLTRRVFDTLSKRGYDEIRVLYDDEKELLPIKETLQVEATMFEIVKKENGFVILRAVSEINKDELKNIMNQIMFLLKEKVNKVRAFIETGEEQVLDDLLELEKANNKLAHLCIRAIHRQEFQEVSYRHYMLLWAIEKMGNDFKFFAHNHPSSLQSSTKKVVETVMTLIEHIVDLFFSYDQKKALSIYQGRKILAEECIRLLKRKDNVNDHFLLHLALSLGEKCVYLLGLLFEFPEEESTERIR